MLALMSLPTIIIAARASIKAVPPSIRDAAPGLGASRLQTSTHHVLPLAMPGILTGSIIAMAQALGETAPLIIIGMNSFIQDPPGGPLDKANVLDQIVEQSLRRAALWEEAKDRLDKPGTGLSGGQQQRLCIARAIATAPEVLLMDEPCSALDPIATAQIEELIDELRASYSVVIVTHSMQQAARVSQKTAFFHLGLLLEYGETSKIFTNPDHEKTQQYITGRFG